MSICSTALRETTFFPIIDGGYLNVSGEHSESFLQRQTSNDIRLLLPGHCLVSVLTSPAGRILDVLSVFNSGNKQPGESDQHSLSLVTLPGRGETTTAYLKSRIFFMDKVNVENRSQDFIQIEVLGLQVDSLILALGFSRLPTEGEIISVEGENPSLIYRTKGTIGMGYRLITPVSHGEWWLSELRRVGAAQLDWLNFNLLRVEAGVPWGDRELFEDYTPLEIGLETVVSDSKGSYTGQEVLARQKTYDKVTQHLCGLRLEKRVDLGALLLAEGKRVGKITSLAESPRFGWIALAVIKRPHHQPGYLLEPSTASGELLRARTAALPFSED